MHRIARPLAGALVGGVLLVATAGCGGGSSGSDHDEDRLDDLAGVQASSVAERTLEEGERGTVVVVDVADDITVDQLTDVLTAVDELGPARFAVYRDWGTTRWPAPTRLDGRDLIDGAAHHEGLTDAATAATFVAAVAAYPDSSVRISERDGVVVDRGEAGPDALTADLRATLGDPVLSHVRGLTFRASTAVGGVTNRVRSAEALTQQTADVFQELAGTIAKAPAGAVAAVSVTDDGVLGIGADLVLPGVIPPAELTTDAWGERLWPWVHRHLDLLATLPKGSTYELSNSYRSTADGLPVGHDPLISLASGGTPAPDSTGRTWGRDAAAYLARAMRHRGAATP